MVSYVNLGPSYCICTHKHKHHTHILICIQTCMLYTHTQRNIFKVKMCKHWSFLRQSTKVSLWWLTGEVHQSSPLMEFLEVVHGEPSCLLAYSLAHPHTLWFSKLDSWKVPFLSTMLCFTLPFLGTVLKTVKGSYRSVPRTNGFTEEPRCAVCCIVWVCVDTCCVMFSQHNHRTHS